MRQTLDMKWMKNGIGLKGEQVAFHEWEFDPSFEHSWTQAQFEKVETL